MTAICDRNEPHTERRMWRAGSCAGQLRPVVALPHDLGTVTTGPIVVAVELDDSSVPAVRFARDLAAK